MKYSAVVNVYIYNIEIEFREFNERIVYSGEIEDALKFAENMLKCWIEEIIQRGEMIPEPYNKELEVMSSNEFIREIEVEVEGIQEECYSIKIIYN